MSLAPNVIQRLKMLALQPKILGSLLEIAGSALLADDILDLGWGSYTREERPYHKDTAPGWHEGRPGDHPSPVHHWQLGALLKWAGVSLQAIAKQKQGVKQ